ncbi:MAG TPA: GYF domain-containing protein [Verrucomicrobiae bacterium]|nr:GYF domain-containing protein [Verrucomicrobiae bacterium]
MYKIIGADGQPYGPVNAEQIQHWIAENRVNAQTLVQAEGAPEWKPLGSISELASGMKTIPPTIAPPPTLAARASNKIPAGICGILLGAFGIHKFILGYTGAGLVMLLVTLLSCFILAPVMHLIGLIEGIIYLCRSDEEFVRVNVDGRKEWF